MADDFENRGFSVVRYSLEPEYIENRDSIADCDVVFIAVPTPTTPDGFSADLVVESVGLVGEGKMVVIKSTILPGTTELIQNLHPDKTVLFSPEFLSKATATHDATHPHHNIVGFIENHPESREKAELVLSILPESNHQFVVSARTAELYKYVHNVHGYVRIVLANLFHDLGTAIDADWNDVKQMMDVNPMMSPYYNEPVHKDGRGAGGLCFIKDFAAFKELYADKLSEDEHGLALLTAMERKNLELLSKTNKNQDIVKDVYGI